MKKGNPRVFDKELIRTFMWGNHPRLEKKNHLKRLEATVLSTHSKLPSVPPDKLEKLLIHRAFGRILRKVFTSVMEK